MAEPATSVYGVDFAASKRDAGRDIWIAEGTPTDDGMLIERVAPAVDVLDGEPTGRQETLAGLSEFIAGQDNAAFGLDFPFGVARDLAEPDRWTAFVRRFPDSLVVDVDEGGDRPAKQLYDVVNREVGDPKSAGVREGVDEVGLSPTDWRMKELTYYGIRDVLQPLVDGDGGGSSGPESDHVAVVPMESVDDESVIVLETYPSEVFNALDANPAGYKGRRERHLEASVENVEALETAGVQFENDGARVEACAYDDALDAAAACYATHRSVADGVDFERKAECFGEIHV